MPCPSLSVSSDSGVEIRDLLELHPFTAGYQYRPSNKAELVRAVIESGSSSLRALGSSYSLSKAGEAANVVSTDLLNWHLSQPLGASRPLPADRLRPGLDVFALIKHDPSVAGRCFVYVEAGIQIRHLLREDLKGCGLALPTMGAGGAQSLAGALSTGTHGADFGVPPLADWIRAVHLVGTGGQEWWITPKGSLFAGEPILVALCDDARVVAEDDAFNAVCVGVGRMGVIYSMILEVVPAYGLIEVNLEHRWSEIRQELSTSGIRDGNPTGVFEAPLGDLDSGWFLRQVLGRSIIRDILTYEPGPSSSASLSYYDKHPEFLRYLLRYLYPRLLSRMGLSDLADELRGGTIMPLHHINIVVNLARPDQCWITRRWRRLGGVRPVNLEPAPRDRIEQAVIDNKRNPRGIVVPLQKRLLPDNWWDTLCFNIGLALGVAEAVRFAEFLTVDMPRIARECTTSVEALFLILYKLATDRVLTNDSKPTVIAAMSQIFGSRFAKLVRAGFATDVLDTHDYDLDGTQTVNSGEFFFDASKNGYLTFIDAVINLANVHSPVFGIIGIRFTPSSAPLIAMQRFPLTVSLEIATGRARQENVYAKFWEEVHDTATKHGGIPHWGQEFRQSAAEIEVHYGENLVTWRRVLAKLSRHRRPTKIFSTAFSRDKGLEPDAVVAKIKILDCDAVELFLVGLAGASD